MSTTSRPVFHARRERPAAASLPRFLGLSAATGRLRRSAALRTSRARLTTAGSTLSAAAAIAMLALLVPASRPALSAIIHAPGDLIQALGGGSAADSATKGYPRLYSVKLGIDVKIQPGDGRTPPVEPIAWQYPNTAPLGQTGNTYLYSHDRPGMFLGLHKAVIGDVIVVEMSATDKLYFQVTEIHGDVAWNDFEWLQHSDDDRLTLQTCNFSGDFDPRYIVVTKEIPASQGRALTGSA